jgi:molybdopterin-guanine dinucleotide biosynthesis protein A
MQGIVVAGAKAPPALQQRGVERIHLLRIGGETLLKRLCRCLIEGGGCTAVHVLAPEDVPLPALPPVRRAPYSGALVDDIMALLRGLPSTHVLLGSADSPLITPEAIAALKADAQRRQAAIGYPVCERRVVEQQVGASKRTYVKLHGLEVTGGNVFWLERDLLVARADDIRRVFALRKHPLGLARVFGLGFMVRFALGWLSLADVEAHLSRLAGGRLCALNLPFAELTVDLDKEADLDFFADRLDPWQSG